jgi:hypothetical protein
LCSLLGARRVTSFSPSAPLHHPPYELRWHRTDSRPLQLNHPRDELEGVDCWQWLCWCRLRRKPPRGLRAQPLPRLSNKRPPRKGKGKQSRGPPKIALL